jgi:hypothetical protein
MGRHGPRVGVVGLRRAHYLNAQFGDDGKLRDADRSDAVLAAFSIGDEAGEPLFTVDDVEALAERRPRRSRA